MEYITLKFPINEEEYRQLDTKYGQLCEFVAWDLLKRNNAANHTDEQTDIAQELRIAMMRAGSYHKRQVFIDGCLALAGKYAQDRFLRYVVRELKELWYNKTRHGANRQKFGPHQEKILASIIRTIVPKKERIKKSASLCLTSKFDHYCKSIIWNAQKARGRKISRERTIRAGQVSISEFPYLGAKSVLV